MEILVYGIPAVALVMAFTQLFKKFVADRWIPLLAVMLGIVLVLVANINNLVDVGVVIGYAIQGIIVGLTACGLWDTSKISVLGK